MKDEAKGTLMRHDMIWRTLYTPAVEHLCFTHDPDGGYRANGCVVGVLDNTPFRISYDVRLNAQWCVREVAITDLLEEKRVVQLLSDGKGQWHNPDGKALPQFEGCLDIDFTATPFTNTLPIRRLQWEVGRTHDIQVVYIEHPHFKVSVARQTYTCLSETRYHFKMEDFEREITVNREGFVTDYPDLFQQVWGSQDGI